MFKPNFMTIKQSSKTMLKFLAKKLATQAIEIGFAFLENGSVKGLHLFTWAWLQ